MKRPQPDAVIELERDGQRFRAMVESIEPDPASTKFFVVTAVLATDAPAIRKGDQVTWIDPRGVGVSVQQAARDVVPKIVLRWIDG